jgi:hypothetical protein
MGWGGVWVGDSVSSTTEVQTVIVTQTVASGPSSPSKTSICNMAIGHAGETVFIANIDTARDKAAILCKRFYDQSVAFILRSFDWQFATRYRTLALVAETPNDDWAYAYRYPTDALKIRRIVTALGRSDSNPPAFVIGQDDQGQLVYSDEQDPTFEYTQRVDNPERFDPLFIEAVAWQLAGQIAPALSRDKNKAKECFQMAAYYIDQAEIAVANEQQPAEQQESEFVRARS